MIDSLLFLHRLALTDHICVQFTYTFYTKVTNNHATFIKLTMISSGTCWVMLIGMKV